MSLREGLRVCAAHGARPGPVGSRHGPIRRARPVVIRVRVRHYMCRLASAIPISLAPGPRSLGSSCLFSPKAALPLIRGTLESKGQRAEHDIRLPALGISF